MKTKSIKLALFSICILILTLFVVGCGGGDNTSSKNSDQVNTDEQQEKITLKLVSAWSENNTMNDAMWMLVEKVKEKSNGNIILEWGGGPEAIPPFELGEALRSGVVDVAWMAHTYNVAGIPVLEGAKLSQLTPAEERSSGAFDFYNQLYEENLNAYYLGLGTPNLKFNLYTTVPIQSLEDFKGLTIRVTPAYSAFVQELGAAPVTTDPGEVYTALERKMIEGYGWPSVGIIDFGWDEVTKNVIEPSFYQVDVVGLVNLDTWNGLSGDIKNILGDAMKEVEVEAAQHFQDMIAKEQKDLEQKGVEVLQLPEQDAKQYLEKAYEAAWDKVSESAPGKASELKQLITK